MLVFLFLLALELGHSHIPTFWLLLQGGHCIRNRNCGLGHILHGWVLGPLG